MRLTLYLFGLCLLLDWRHAQGFGLKLAQLGSSQQEPATTRLSAHKRVHYKWPSMANVHRILADKKFHREDFQDIIVSEKLDGANLGIQVDGRDGSLVALHGRNSILWHVRHARADPYHLTYGSVSGRFGESLRQVMEPLKQTVLALQAASNDDDNIIPTDEQTTSFVFYGEWFRPAASKGQKKEEIQPSWHPFGVSLIKADGSRSTHSMTSALHALLTSNGLEPPRILARTKDIPLAIEAIYPKMIDTPVESSFEGVVLTLDTDDPGNPRVQLFGLGCKWKTAVHEEQPRFLLDDVGYSKDLEPTVQLLKQVYDQRQASQAASRKARKRERTVKEKEEEDEITRQVLLAFHSVMSKSALSAEEIRNMQDREARTAQLQRINREVVLALEEQYEQVGIPELPKEVRKAAGSLVSRCIMKPPTA